MSLSHMSLFEYYKLNFSLAQHHKWSIGEIENMMPWERETYVALLIQWVEEENERQKNSHR